VKTRRQFKPWLIVLLLGLALLLARPVLALSIPNEDVEITMSDGAILTGRLFDPSQKPESEDEAEAPAEEEGAEPVPPSVRYPLVILLHGLSGSNTDWDVLIPKLVKEGYAVFAQDLRGHGGSLRMRKSKKTWRIYQKTDWDQMPRDVERVIRYFETGEGKEEYPQVNASKVGLVGTKLGANVALIGAARLGDQSKNPIKVLILMAPSLDYKGLQTAMPIVNYRGPILMMASQTDPVSFEQTQVLYRWALGARSIRLYKNIGDSTDMLRRQPDTQVHLMSWLKKYLPPTAQTPPAR